MTNPQTFKKDVVSAISEFFAYGAGPTHKELSRCFQVACVDDHYEFQPNQQDAPNKVDRLLAAFAAAESRGTAQKLFNCILSDLRHRELIGSENQEPDLNETRLKRVLRKSGFDLTDDGYLQHLGSLDLQTGGREALEETLNRLRRADGDPALAIGTAKELLESVAKFVLEELSMTSKHKPSFDELCHRATDELNLHPKQTDDSIPGYKIIRKINQSALSIAQSVNELRNLQGTGHGRTLPTGVPPELARFVVREACSVAEYLLSTLDKKLKDGQVSELG